MENNKANDSDLKEGEEEQITTYIEHKSSKNIVQNLVASLQKVTLDPVVGIKTVSVAMGNEVGYYAAEITAHVQAHVHRHGDELYHILEGNGFVYLGKVEFEDGFPVNVTWEVPLRVKTNDVFNIPEGHAHSLVNAGERPLIIGFICPQTHLTTDRYIIDTPPFEVAPHATVVRRHTPPPAASGAGGPAA